MTHTLDHYTTVYSTYEQREDAFRRSVAFKLARRYAGPAVFWQDFSRITREGALPDPDGRVAYIPSNPRDCLAFGTARQVLMAAAMTAQTDGPDIMAQVMRTADDFGIAEQLIQPIRTLSGGETVKLALAKSYLGLTACSRMVIASPFTWLSRANRRMLEALAAESTRLGKDLSLLILEGEEDVSTIQTGDPFSSPASDTILFSLSFSDVRIPLALSLNPLAAGASHAVIRNASLQLRSPCLIVGDNGQGKSLVARTLSGAVSGKGRAVVLSDREPSGQPRLLFQDVLTQTMLRSFKALLSSAGADKEATLRTYAAIKDDFAAAWRSCPEKGRLEISAWDAPEHHLLDIKAVLVAARLATAPAALILDEPDWGLSRRNAIAFVSAVSAAAHRQRTPLLLISHKPWWFPLANSMLRVSRTTRKEDPDTTEPAFAISVAAEEVLQ